jgi:WD40 repeat protein
LAGCEIAISAEPPTEPILRIDPGEHTAPIRRIAADDQGRWLATASQDKTVRLWSLVDGGLLSTLRPPLGAGDEGKLFAVALSPDGTIVAAAGWTQFNQGGTTAAQDGHSIYLFERISGRLLRRIPGLPGVIAHLAFSPDGRWLASSSAGKSGVRVFSAASGQLLAEDRDYGDASYSAQFSGQVNGETRLLTTSFDGLLRLYRFDGSRLTLLVKRAAAGGKRPYSARFSSDGQRIAVVFDDTAAVNVLDGDSLALRFAPDTAGFNKTLLSIAWSRDRAELFAAGRVDRSGEKFIRRWNEGGAGTASDWPAAGSTITDLVPLPGGRLAFSSTGPTWGVVDEAGQKILSHVPAVADFRESYENFRLSHDGAQVRFSYDVSGKFMAVFDSVHRQFLARDVPNLLSPIVSAPGLAVTDWKNTTNPKINGSPLNLASYETARSLALWPDGEGFVLGKV